MNEYNEAPRESASLPDYLAAVKRRRKLIAVVAVPIVIITVVLAIGLPDVYVSSAIIEFDKAKVPTQIVAAPRTDDEKSFADQYVASLAESVLRTRNLREMLKDVPAAGHGKAERDAIETVKRSTNIQTIRVPVLDPESGREREVVSGFTVTFESRDAVTAVAGANWLTDAMLAASRTNLQERAGTQAKFYSAEAERYRAQISGIEQRLADFRAKNFGQLPELTGVNMSTMDRTERDLQSIDLQIQQLRSDRVFVAQTLVQAESAGPDANLLQSLEMEYQQKQAIYDASHPDLLSLKRRIDALKGGAAAGGSLRSQLATQRSILAQARQRYSDDHPDIKQIQRRIDTLETRIANGETTDSIAAANPAALQARTQLNAIDSQLVSLQARGAQLRQKLGELERRVESTPLVEREYQTLTRDLELARTKYDELLKSQMNAEITQAAIAGGGSDDLRLVQSPVTPSDPQKPRRLAILIVGTILALIAALSAAIVAEGLDQNVRGSRDVRNLLDVAPLAVVPEIQDAATVRRERAQAVTLISGAMASALVLLAVLRSLT
jgi:polysaccharide biosynthesis transport protein